MAVELSPALTTNVCCLRFCTPLRDTKQPLVLDADDVPSFTLQNVEGGRLEWQSKDFQSRTRGELCTRWEQGGLPPANES